MRAFVKVTSETGDHLAIAFYHPNHSTSTGLS